MGKIEYLKFWTIHDLQTADDAKTYKELAKIALRVLKRQRKSLPRNNRHIAIVSGSISNGNTLSPSEIRANLRRFAKKINELKGLGIPVFNQLPFEKHLFRIKRLAGKKHRPLNLLMGFYWPIFSSGYVTLAFFLPNWKQSHGARWEKRRLSSLRIQIFFTD